ncbi:hypothetical protein CsatB_020190 [Cannabis sativa]
MGYKKVLWLWLKGFWKAVCVSNGADVLVEALEHEGVTDVFAYPGGASMEIHQALTRSSSIQNVLPRHEQGGIFAAEGYAHSAVVKGFESSQYKIQGGGANVVNAPETLMSLSWLLFPLGSLCFWFTWPPSPSPEPASTLLGASVQPSSTTRNMPGMITGSSGWDHSLELHWLHFTTRSSSEPSHSKARLENLYAFHLYLN